MLRDAGAGFQGPGGHARGLATHHTRLVATVCPLPALEQWEEGHRGVTFATVRSADMAEWFARARRLD